MDTLLNTKNNNEIELSFSNKMFSIFTLCFFQIKTLAKTPMMMFMIFGLPNILLLGLGVLLAESDLFVPGFGLPLILTVGIIFGHLYYSSSSTTLDNNFRLTKINPKMINFSIIITILVVCFLSFSFEFIVMITFTSLNLIFSVNWPFFGDAFNARDALIINWGSISWIQVMYFWLMTVILSFTFFTMFRVLFKTNQTFSMFVFSFFLYTLCFGHSTFGVFVRWQSDNNQIWSGSFEANPGAATMQYNKWSDYAALLTPQNFLNQVFYSMFYSGSTPLNPSANDAIPAFYNFFNWSDDPSYNYALVMPFIYLFGMFSFSFFVLKD